MSPDGAALADLLIMVGFGATALVLLTALACRVLPAARLQRGAWLTCLLAVSGLMAGELTGVGAGLAAATRAALPTARAARGAVEPAVEAWAAGIPPRSDVHVASSAGATAVSADSGATSTAAGGTGSQGGTARSNAETLLRWSGLLWLVVTVVLASRLAVQHVLLALFVSRHGRSTRHPLSGRIAMIAARLGLRRPVAVIEARCIDSPIALGLVRPTIGLPAGFAGRYALLEQDVMLAHEISHLAGGDPVWRLVADALAACLWWNPAIWFMRSRLIEASESLADEASLMSRSGPETLAACLVRLAGEGHPHRPLVSLGMAGDRFRSSLGRRVSRLLTLAEAGIRPSKAGRWARVLPCLAVVVVVPVLFVFTAAARSQPPIPGGVDMRVIDAAWRRSVAGGMLVAAFASQVQAGDPPEAEAAAAARAGDVVGADNAPEKGAGAGASPAAGRPTMRQAGPTKQLPKKQGSPRVPPAAQQRPRRPAGMGMQAGVGARLTPEQRQARAAEESERILADMTDERRAALRLPVGVAEGYLKEMEAEALRIERDIRKGGGNVEKAAASGPGGSFIRTMRLSPTVGSAPVDKAALLERIRRPFCTDVRRFDTGVLVFEIRDHSNSARMVVVKHPDRVVSLLDDEGQWTLQIDRLDGRSIHKGVVMDHVDGSDVPAAHLQDFRYTAEILVIPLDGKDGRLKALSHRALRDVWGQRPGR